MASTMVIKVKYGDTLRRFNARVDENDKLDLDMGGLRAKIFSLFSFQLDADISMTYIDEDGDVVTLVDDDDLRDAMRQNMKFLRIDVHTKNDNAGNSFSKSSGNSTPLRSPRGPYPLPNFNAAEVLKSVPEPLREMLAKLNLDLSSKAASSSPVLAELVDCFSKMGLSYLNHGSQVQAGGDSGNPNASSVNPSNPASNDASGSKESLTPAFNYSVDLNALPADSNPAGPTPVTSAPAGSSLHAPYGRRKKAEKSTAPVKNANDMSKNHFNECPFTGTPIANDSAGPDLCRRMHPSKRNHTEAMGGMFHTGVQCDGCGCHPIVGPRFKSVVKEDYDLCRICFSSMGKVADYIRIDHPVSVRHPRHFSGIYDQLPWMGPPILPKILRGCSMKPGRPKLDSRFVLDVNVIDGTVMAPSTPFTKMWRMRNNGGVIWPKGTQLMWIGGDKFSKSNSVEIEVPFHGLGVEHEIDIAVDFTAPESPGRYISYWRMASPSGQKFGQRVWVLIQVDGSLKNSLFESFQGLNLNLPPENMVPQPHEDSSLLQPSSSSVKEPEKPMPREQPQNDQDLNFPINDSLLVGQIPTLTAPVVPSTVLYPTVDQTVPPLTAPGATSTVTYPTVDMAESEAPHSKSSPVAAAPTSAEGTSSNNAKEEALLKELEAMGFKQVNLNKEVLRMNEYNLEQSVDDLCEVADWDPILDELKEMGFSDTETNKKLLVKNNGSIKRVVMDLINGDK